MINIIAKEGARDFYFAALFAPVEKRDALWAIAAFHAEITSIRKKTHQAIAGEVRLQWWIDCLKANEKANPVLKALLEIDFLPRDTLIAKAEAHIFDLYDDPHQDKSDMEGYYGETISSMMMIAALILNNGQAVHQSELAGYAGVAYGLWKNNENHNNYSIQAKELYLNCPKQLRSAFLPLHLTDLKQDTGDFRKLLKYFMAT